MPQAINLKDLPQAKLKDLLEFPCAFTFKVVGIHREDLVEDVVAITQVHAKGDCNPRQQRSSKGTYNSVSIDIIAEHIDQIETLYLELAKITGVRMVL
ncbi:hypothetical protein A6046_02445 [[Haemophilus] ducreyi]|uniref:UPF0250 protein HD_2015 n=2 Tax=Haemophilus ducreyi TaxID=730 RepID=Y2015_HAEDU|nr:DUF493 family protein YbeD [[Haemophilus] ducreyi]Q7VKA8.1 RecName: Full=UPF0250 protein HD_2015 [[Haemophilus] ducreyi 35000HP]AAP96724.1 hypothetical protein HD_2015 [[Haemophilus] ducreyi 35000HP]AKO31547.1 hypothetical protein RY60_07800 [[Haemophilus] ducreyi]AKO33004.1 hypothetical protein RZ57_07880 [[Haemophilus] ducreyi]AKO34450.1 hypothetical protein RZ58_07870 [[Haemophilus] ducreyi]AKO37348.1 hypothetical protein RZ61_07985 [[Haemophilus] ducreyi]